MDSIKNIIPQVINSLSRKKVNNQSKIPEIWQNILDKDARQHAAVSDFEQGHLWVNVDSSPWLYRLNLQKSKILKKLKEEIPEIQKLSFKIGKTT